MNNVFTKANYLLEFLCTIVFHFTSHGVNKFTMSKSLENKYFQSSCIYETRLFTTNGRYFFKYSVLKLTIKN